MIEISENHGKSGEGWWKSALSYLSSGFESLAGTSEGMLSQTFEAWFAQFTKDEYCQPNENDEPHGDDWVHRSTANRPEWLQLNNVKYINEECQELVTNDPHFCGSSATRMLQVQVMTAKVPHHHRQSNLDRRFHRWAQCPKLLTTRDSFLLTWHWIAC
jgi:hypothetical protein